jgi:hypothetical protein
MPANNERNTLSPREQLESIVNESFGERTPRKLFKMNVGDSDMQGASNCDALFEEFFYLSDEEAFEVCRGLIASLKPYASRRADRDGRPKHAAANKAQQGTPNPGANPNNNNNRGNRRDQHTEERDLVHT